MWWFSSSVVTIFLFCQLKQSFFFFLIFTNSLPHHQSNSSLLVTYLHFCLIIIPISINQTPFCLLRTCIFNFSHVFLPWVFFCCRFPYLGISCKISCRFCEKLFKHFAPFMGIGQTELSSSCVLLRLGLWYIVTIKHAYSRNSYSARQTHMQWENPQSTPNSI